MANTLDGIRNIVRQILRDKFDPAVTPEWESSELDVHIGDVLREISLAKPYEVRESVSLSANSVEVDISSIEDLISIPYGEYPVDTTPEREYRNVKIFGNTARIITNRRPSGTETAYLYCHKMHTLTESQSTLSPDIERLLVLGVTAKAASSRARELIDTVSTGGTRTPQEEMNWSLTRLAEYRSGLRAITKQRVTQFYPED